MSCMSKFTHFIHCHHYAKHKLDCTKSQRNKILKALQVKKHFQDAIKKSLKYLLAFNYIFKKNITSFFSKLSS